MMRSLLSHDRAGAFGSPRYRFARYNFDWPLFLSVALIAVIGVINLYSATSVAKTQLQDVYIQQIYWLFVGGLVAAFVAAIDYRHYERLAYGFYLFGIVLLVLVFVLGRDIRGSSRWVSLGFFSFQPSEFMKLFLVVALAKHYHADPETGPRTLKDLIAPAAIAAVPMMLVLKQPDLGTALILALILISICSLMQIRARSLVTLLVSASVLGPVVWTYVLKDYQRQRVMSFLNPEANILGANWHAHHARVAVGSGGWFGHGFMRGTQNQYLFLPDQQTDFPFPVFAEDWGFFGSVFLVILYGFLVIWSIRVASLARDRFGSALAIGIGALIFWQALFNLGMVLGLLPVVGVTLPLFSYGGSSVLTVLIGIGLLMNVSIRRSGGVPIRASARLGAV